MGLLDDAIKEHLELKRRHGADPSEVARLEHEALGPARREPATVAPVAEEEPPAEETAAQAEPAADERHYDYEDDDPGYGDEVTADERLETPVRERAREAAATAPVADPDAEQRPPVAEREAEPRAPVEQPEPEQPEPEQPEVEQPTEQFSLEELEEAAEAAGEPADDEAPEPQADVVPADEEPGNDDVLEETPDFLQETPEHDRLWFEQKPPRDFDF